MGGCTSFHQGQDYILCSVPSVPRFVYRGTERHFETGRCGLYERSSKIDCQFRREAETLQCGIVPRPASASRALLRLTPCHRTYRGLQRVQTSGIPGSLELTGGEYKTRERIHRSVADLRLLAIPAS